MKTNSMLIVLIAVVACIFTMSQMSFAISIDQRRPKTGDSETAQEQAKKVVDEEKKGGPKGGVVMLAMLAETLKTIQDSLNTGKTIDSKLLNGARQDLATLARISATVEDFKERVLDGLRNLGINDTTLDLFFNTKLATYAENNIISLAATKVLNEETFNQGHMEQVANILKDPRGRIVVFVVNEEGQVDDIIRRFVQNGVSLEDYIGRELDFVMLAGVGVNYSLFEALFDAHQNNIANCTLDRVQDKATKAALRKV